jgi:RND family efflux transporter MFP subunit
MPSTLLLAATLIFVGPQADEAAAADQAIVLDGCNVSAVDEVEVPSKLVGVLTSVEVREGDEVRADQEVARLDDKRAAIALEISTEKAKNDVNVRYAQKAAEVAVAEYEQGWRANLTLAGTIPNIEMRRLLLNSEKGKLQIEQADRDYILEGLQRELDQVTFDDHAIKSPIDGIVIEVAKNVGEAVTAGELVLKVRNIDELRVEGYLRETEVPHARLSKGQIVEFHADLVNPALASDKPAFRGKLTYVEPGIDQATTIYKVFAIVKNNDARELLPGMKGAMTIVGAGESVARQDAP